MSSSPEPRLSKTLKAIIDAPEYFAEISDLANRIGSSRDETELVRLLQEISTRIGADSSFFVSFVREDASFESYRFLLACDPLWYLAYEQAACYANGPWLTHSRHHSQPIRGSEITAMTERQQAVMQLAERFGFRSTIVVPAPAGAGLSRLGVLVLGSGIDGFFEREGYAAIKVLARSLAMELHECCTALVRRELLARSKVSAEDLALLAYERDGHGTKSIARLTGASCEAIDTRFRRLNAKLRAPNRAVSARLAAEYGLI